MAKKNLEIVREGEDLIIKALLSHGPGGLHTMRLTPTEANEAWNAVKGQRNRLANRVAINATTAMKGEAREECMKGVDGCGDEVGFLGKVFRKVRGAAGAGGSIARTGFRYTPGGMMSRALRVPGLRKI